MKYPKEIYLDGYTYEDNAINDLLYMKKLKTEIAELELMLQMFRVYEDGNK